MLNSNKAHKERHTLIANLLNKTYGVGTAVMASDLEVPDTMTTGLLSLDTIFGGGLPVGEWVEYRGAKSAGKSSLMHTCVAANQKMNPDFNALWVASETYDKGQAKALGVDLDRVTVVPTKKMELAFQTMIDAHESGEVDLCILDSYPALSGDEEVGKAMDEFTTAIGARNFGKFIRKIGANPTDGKQMSGVIINQYRQRPGAYAPRGNTPMTTPGGEAKDYFYYIILKLARDEWITEKRPGYKDAVTVGQTIKMTTEKNKAAPPQQMVSLDFYFRNAPILGFKRGEFDIALDYFTVASLFGIIQKRGAWYYYKDYKWQGKQSVLESLREDLDLREDLAEQVLAAATIPELADQLVSEDRDED
jgi:recombination protein RecA